MTSNKAPTLADRWAAEDKEAPLFGGNKPNVVGYRKQDKETVHYGRAKDAQHACGICRHFKAPDKTCERVKGLISSGGWCELWKHTA